MAQTRRAAYEERQRAAKGIRVGGRGRKYVRAKRTMVRVR